MTSRFHDGTPRSLGNKVRFSFLSLFVLGLLMIPSCSRKEVSLPAVPDTFLAAFRTAWSEAEHHTDLLAAFYCWDGLQEANRNRILQSLQYDSDTPIASLFVEPWDPTRDPARFFSPDMLPNLTPEGILVIEFKSRPRTSYRQPIGRRDGRWLIIHAIQNHDASL